MALFGFNYQPRLFKSRRQSFVVVSDGTRISGAVVFDDNSGAGDSFPDYIVQDPITQDLDNNNFAGPWSFISIPSVEFDGFVGYSEESPISQTLNNNGFGGPWEYVLGLDNPWFDQFVGYSVEDPITQTLNNNTFSETGTSWSFIS